jgi:hypothetical protein
MEAFDKPKSFFVSYFIFYKKGQTEIELLKFLSLNLEFRIFDFFKAHYLKSAHYFFALLTQKFTLNLPLTEFVVRFVSIFVKFMDH